MNLKEQLTVSWTFILAVALYIILTFISKLGINIDDVIWGISHILLVVSITYTAISSSRVFHRKRRFVSSHSIMYGAGILSAIWLLEAIKFFLN
jgi:hypothetical protein